MAIIIVYNVLAYFQVALYGYIQGKVGHASLIFIEAWFLHKNVSSIRGNLLYPIYGGFPVANV